ncbi:MAG TPA: carotenoid oxygenase family protein [Streptosporangiaceae bacterium]|nr:carotenoid oxygenase family protein [Streptosporangiaceae bacterium]
MPEALDEARAARDHRLGFQTLDQERPPAALPVEGTLPDWLSGSLLRTGPARFEVGSRGYNHWFDGLAMLHRFAFAGGAVTYANRFLDSPAYRAARDTGRIAYSEFATDPCRTLFRRVATSLRPPEFGQNANVSVVAHAGEFLALTESPLPVVFDPRTLETLGVAPPAPGQMTVAHPHRAPRSGELVSYATHFGPRTSYRIYAQDERTGRRRVLARVPVSRPAYMHSFAITEHHLVLAEFPFVVVPVAIPLSGRPLIANYRWRPGLGTRFRVFDLDRPGASVTLQGEPFFAFHHVNAYERGDEIVLDLCAYDNADIIGALYLDRLRTGSPRLPEPALRRYRLPLRGGDATREALPAVGLELPRIDYDRRNGRPYRYVYGTGLPGDGGFPDRITKADVEGGPPSVWSRPGTYPGEPVFVPAPGGRREDDGVLLSVVLDPGAGTSFLLVLDAGDLGEIARAAVPHPIPFGFHGDYFPGLT